MRTISTCGLLLALLLPQGCGGSDTSTSAQTAGQPPAGAQANTAQSAGTQTGQPAAGAAGACSIVDGPSAAAAAGGAFVDARQFDEVPPNQAKCTVTVEIDGKPSVFVIWQMPADDFQPLKDAEEDPLTGLTGLGDAAFVTFHPDTKRYEVAATKQGKFTIQVFGDEQELAQKVAKAIIGQY